MLTETAGNLITIRQLAQRLGVHPETIRRWERRGIIAPAVRRHGTRVYLPDDVAQVEAAVLVKPSTSEME